MITLAHRSAQLTKPRHIVYARGKWHRVSVDRRGGGSSVWPGGRYSRTPLRPYSAAAKLLAVVAIGVVGCVGAPSSKEVEASGRAEVELSRRSAPVQNISLCVIEDGELKTVTAVIDTPRGDTLVDGRSWRDVYPATHPPYALGASWLARGFVILDGRHYAPYGLPDVIEPHLLIRVGEFRNVPVFAETGIGEEVPSAVFIPTRPGCEFQPYVGQR